MSRYNLTDFERREIKPLLTKKPRGVRRVDDRRAERHCLGAQIRCALARPAGALCPAHYLLQSLRTMAKGGRMGLADGRDQRRVRRYNPSQRFAPYAPLLAPSS